MRIDRWLWCTRFFKSRGLAAEAVNGGHVKLGGQRCKPARVVRVGDSLAITKGEATWHVTVAALPSRRGPAAEARACFTESEASVEQRNAQRLRRRSVAEQSPTSGRPDKRTRRLIRGQRGRS